MSEQQFSELSFTSLQLPEPLARGIADAGFERCTPIQAQTLPRALAGLDVAGQAQTGTGKTAAFLVALYSRLLRNEPAAGRPVTSPRALILAPTRELALQIHHDAEILGQYTGLVLGLAFGGVDYDKQRRHIEAGVDVLIGTPGRLIDYLKQHVFDLRHAEALVLDEADRMFDLGFIKDIRYLLRRLPPPDQRLNMLFSATLSQRVLELAYEHMNDPELIRIEPERITAENVRQAIYFPSMDEKAPLLIHLLKKKGATRSMVFVNTKRVAEYLERKLRANGIEAAAMSGDVPQSRRMRMLRDFHDGKIAVLVATDVAARGLHIPEVSHVFNYDLPQDAQDYVHRIGRTARAGASGDAISLGCEEYVVTLPEIEAFIGRKLPVEQFDPHELPEVASASNVPRHQDTQSWREREERRAGRGREAPRRGARRPQAAAPPPPPAPKIAAPPPEPAAGSPDAPARKKRRRRRRRSPGPGPGDTTPPASE